MCGCVHVGTSNNIYSIHLIKTVEIWLAVSENLWRFGFESYWCQALKLTAPVRCEYFGFSALALVTGQVW